jgi:hypothetical protein
MLGGATQCIESVEPLYRGGLCGSGTAAKIGNIERSSIELPLCGGLDRLVRFAVKTLGAPLSGPFTRSI